MKRNKSLALYLLLIAGILVMVNLLASRFFFRIDLTEDNRYTLSRATRDLLRELQEPVTVSAYFSEGLPPDIDKVRRDFRELLSEYASRSGGKIVYEFINPNRDPEAEQEAYRNGISPVMINVREKDQAVQKKAFLGAVLKYGEKTEVLPFIQPGTAMEYALSAGIRKMTADEKNAVGFIQGHGEPTTTMFAQAMEALSVLNRAEPVNLTDSTYLARYKTLVIAAPTDSFPDAHLAMIDRYLGGGGNLVIALNRVEGDLQQAMGREVATGLEAWLETKGVRIAGDFIVDANCGSINVVQQQGYFSITSQLSFPYLPLFTRFADHPVTSGLEAVLMQFASPITYSGDTSFHFVPLVMSSDKAGTQSTPMYFDIQKKWGEADFPLKGLVAAALLEGRFSGTNRGRLILFGDGDFAVNGQGNQAHQLSPDNVNLLVNAIDWLSDDTGLIGLRTRGITSRTLDPLDEGKKSLLKWLNVLLPVVLILLYGFFRMQRNQMIREKRRREDYNR